MPETLKEIDELIGKVNQSEDFTDREKAIIVSLLNAINKPYAVKPNYTRLFGVKFYGGK